jgi:hypothetical protein
MLGLIALVAICGAAYLGIRRPRDEHADVADPRLSPFVHY